METLMCRAKAIETREARAWSVEGWDYDVEDTHAL
jgi:hypothetical protein